MLKAVLFDLDGVIVKSAKANLLLYQTLMAEFGFRKPSKRKFMPLAPHGSKRTIQALLPTKYSKNEKLVERMRSRMKEIAPDFIKYISLSKNARRLFAGLKNNYCLGIVTNRRKSTFKILEKFGIGHFFNVVITADHAKNIKPHPEPLLKALRKLKVKPSEAIYIGDTAVDRVAGNRAKVKTIIVKGLNGVDKIVESFRNRVV